MRIAITGSTGMIGTALVAELMRAGHSITRVTRRRREAAPGEGVVLWDPEAGTIDDAGLEGHDVVINLAGASIYGVWTPARKARIRQSRVGGTRLLAETLARLERPPRTLLSASGSSYYGDRPADEPLDEESAPGTGFLAEVVQAWERATEPAVEAGIRVVRMRFAPVLSPRGGMLAVIAPVTRLGLGARLGNGRQVISWIALDDVVGAARHVLAADLSGAVNFASPNAVSNAEFVRTLGRVLRRPTPLVLPDFVLRTVPGGMGVEMLLSGARVVPRRLRESGYVLSAPELEGALRRMLRRPA